MIALEFLNKNNLHNEIAKDYWLLDEQNKFVYTVKDLQIKYELKQSEIIKTVQSIVIAHNMDICCSEYGFGRICSSRSDYTSSSFHSSWVCQDCINYKNQILIDHKKELLASCKLKAKKTIEYLSVKNLAYLIALIKHSSYGNGITINNIISDKSYLLTPSTELDFELLRFIDHENICIISEMNNLSSIQEHENGGYSYNLYNILRDVWVDVYSGISDLVTIRLSYLIKLNQIIKSFFSYWK